MTGDDVHDHHDRDEHRDQLLLQNVNALLRSYSFILMATVLPATNYFACAIAESGFAVIFVESGMAPPDFAPGFMFGKAVQYCGSFVAIHASYSACVSTTISPRIPVCPLPHI